MQRSAASTPDEDTRRTLRAFAAHHLEQKAIAGTADRQWLASAQLHLEEACTFFGPNTDLADIKVKSCSEYMKHLSKQSNGRVTDRAKLALSDFWWWCRLRHALMRATAVCWAPGAGYVVQPA